MICVYEPKTIDFNNNGTAVLSPVSCIVTEELNGGYELEMVHPFDIHGKWKYLESYSIIKAPVPNKGNQLFRIYQAGKIMSNGIHIKARHIFYDLLYNFIRDCSITYKTPGEALKAVIDGTAYKSGFTCESDLTVTLNASYKNTNPVNALIGDESSLLNISGAEILRDNRHIALLKNIGSDRGVRVSYGKNLKGLEYTEDASDTVTRIVPYSGNTYLPEFYIDSPLISRYPFPFIRAVEFTDSEDDIYGSLRNGANRMFADGCDLPDINIKVDFVNLEKTEEYKEYKCLETVNLGDSVTVSHPGLGIDIKAKCVRYKYNCLTEKYDTIELGTVKKSLSDDSIETDRSVAASRAAISGVSSAAQTLSNDMGGNVLKRNGELLIMDTDNISTAKNIWKWDKNGLSYSDSGYLGPWRVRLDMNGNDTELNALRLG